MTKHEQLDRAFTYHPPRSGAEGEAQIAAYTEIRNQAYRLGLLIANLCPDGCREASLAQTKVEEAVMWANAAIARPDPMAQTFPVPLPDVAGYHGDTTPLAPAVTVAWPASVGSLAGTETRLQIRDKHENLYLDTVVAFDTPTAGRIEFATVDLTPEQWRAIPRRNDVLDFELEMTHPAVGTHSVFRGCLSVTRDVARPASP